MEFDFKKAMDECLPQAVDSLKQAMREGGPNMLKAAEIVLNYTQGKPEDKSAKNGGVTVLINNFARDENGNVITANAIEHNPSARLPVIKQDQYVIEATPEEY